MSYDDFEIFHFYPASKSEVNSENDLFSPRYSSVIHLKCNIFKKRF